MCDPLMILKFTLSRWVFLITRHPPGKKHNSITCESFLLSTYGVASFFFSPKIQRKQRLISILASGYQRTDMLVEFEVIHFAISWDD